MASTNGLRLLSDYRALNRWFEHLDASAHEEAKQHILYADGVTEASVTSALTKRLLLYPAQLSVALDVTIDGRPTLYRRKDGEHYSAYTAALRVPYTGSPLLLRTAPEPGYTFPYKARIGKRAIKLLTLLPNQDATAFVQEAADHVERASVALHASWPRVAEYNDRVRVVIERVVKSI